MTFKDILTSEKLKAFYPNQFDLVNSAINCARELIRSENRAPVDEENLNIAAQAIHILELEMSGEESILDKMPNGSPKSGE